MRGLQYNEECLRIAEKEHDIELMAPVAFDLCSNYASRGLFKRIVDTAPGILELLEQTGKESESFGRGYNVYSALSAFYGFSQAYLGDYDKGREVFEKGLSHALKIGNLYSLGLIELFYGYAYCNQGDGGTALPHFEKSISYLEKGQIFVLLGLAWSGIGHAYYFMGRPEQALPYVEKGLEIHSDANIGYNLSVHYWFLASVHCDLGSLDRARTYIDEALKLAERNHEVYYVGLSFVTLGRILGKQGGQVREAEDAILRGITILGDLGGKPQVGIGHLCLAELYALSNQPEKAFVSLKAAEAIFQEARMHNWLAKTEAALAMFLQS
jgi:tetratricopeptide (TPR) repeat protein